MTPSFRTDDEEECNINSCNIRAVFRASVSMGLLSIHSVSEILDSEYACVIFLTLLFIDLHNEFIQSEWLVPIWLITDTEMQMTVSILICTLLL